MLILSPNSQQNARFTDFFFFFLLCLKVRRLSEIWKLDSINTKVKRLSLAIQIGSIFVNGVSCCFASKVWQSYFGLEITLSIAAWMPAMQISLRRARFASSSLIAISNKKKKKKKKHLPSCVCIASNEWCVSEGEEHMRPDEIKSTDWLEDNQAPFLKVTVSLPAAFPKCVFLLFVCFNWS